MKQMIERTSALASLLLALFYLGDYPVFSGYLMIGAVVYICILLWRQELWLLILPMLLPAVYLASWSGRVFLTEFDALVILTLASALWRGQYTTSFRHIRLDTGIIITGFLMLYLASTLNGLLPLDRLDANATANYYSNLNSLRVARGLFWALLLYPAWAAQRKSNHQAAQNLLVTGLSLGALMVFLLVLWERNVIHTLIFWINKYAPIQALLNFSTNYRVTAMFADMHTGGTAIDGYLLLVFPFTAMALFKARSIPAIGLYSITLFGTLYACMTTFSRGVYLGIGIAIITTTIIVLWHNRHKLSLSGMLILAIPFPILLVTGFIAFRSGGTIPLLYGIIAFLAGAIHAVSRPAIGKHILWVIGMILLLLIALTTWSISARNYAFTFIPPALLAIITTLPNATAGYFMASRSSKLLSTRQIGISLTAFALLVGLLTPSLFGYRMESRFSTAAKDLLHRVEHWQLAVDIMDKDMLTALFGQGVGKFPATYFWQHQKARDVGGFKFQQENGNQFLRYLGAHDVRLGQRISLEDNTNYILSLNIRTDDEEALLYLRACHRQLIHPSEWNPRCFQFSEVVKSTKGKWKRMQFALNSGKVGSLKNYLQAPLIFTLSNRREYRFNLKPQTVLDMDNISILNVHGVEHIQNGDFTSGIDNWFAYYDYNHLPWHIKNIWIHVYFETGIVGLILFIALILKALSTTLRQSRQSDFALAIFVSVAGFLAVGSFGTLIDSPRIAFLFYLLILIGLGSHHMQTDTKPS
jgi:hypothetical protein